MPQTIDRPQPLDRSQRSDRLQVMNDIVTVLVGNEQTGGAYVVFETITQPQDGVPLLHVHPHQETFRVLEGTFQIFGRDDDGNKTAMLARAGSVVHVPGGVPHGYLNVGEEPGKMLLIVEPGSFEDFFRDLGAPVNGTEPTAPSGPPDMEALLEVCTRHGIHFLEAPPQ